MNHRNYIMGIVMALLGSTSFTLTRPAHATSIISTTGDLSQGAIPASLLVDATENTQIMVYRDSSECHSDLSHLG